MIDLKPACLQMIELLRSVTDDQLSNPTPCADYTVGDLIEHIDEAAHGFAALAGNDAGDGDVAAHVRALGEAWDDQAAWQGSSDAAGVELSNEQWGRIALTEMVIHGWDLAQATGQTVDFDEETVRACLDHVTAFVPNAPIPELWGTPTTPPPDATPLHAALVITGRTP